MKKIGLLITILLFVCAVQLSFAAPQTNWSKWRGPDNNGISKETDWNPAALNKMNKKWSVQVGYGYANVSIQDDYVYTMGHANNKDTVFCLDFKTGKTVWKHSYDASLGSYKGTRATPIFSDGKIYTLGRDGDIFCFNAKSGKILWHKNIASDYNVSNIEWHFSSSPYIYKNMILLNANKSGIALNKDNGSLVWKSKSGLCSYATPVLFTRNSIDYVAMFSQMGLYIINPDTGKSYAFYEWITKYDINAADPLVTDKGIFISSTSGCALLKFNGSSLTKVYENSNMQSHFSSSLLIGKYIYGISGSTYFGRTKLTCMELATGEKYWKSKNGIEAVIAAGQNLLSITKRGELVISKITPTKHQIIAKQKVIKDRKSEYWTAPTLCRGFVFCRSGNGELVCIDLNK